MESLGALSVAAAAVEFLEFGARLFTDPRRIYHSSSGAKENEIGLSRVTNDFWDLIENFDLKFRNFGLEKATSSQQRNHVAENPGDMTEDMLINALDQAKEIGRMLRAALAKLEARGGSIRLQANGFTPILARALSDAEIRNLETQLDQAQKRITMEILAKKNNTTMAEFIRQLATIIRRLRSVDEVTRRYVEGIVDLVGGETADGLLRFRDLVRYVLDSNWQPDERMRLVAQQCSENGDSNRPYGYKCTELIVRSLWFRAMNGVEEELPEAHRDTYQPIFQRPRSSEHGFPLWSDFPQWLSGASDGIYWITGRSGAGKSTLIKFMTEHETLTSLLRSWAGSPSIVILATYRPWNSERSPLSPYEALLRALLHSCLVDYPHILVPVVFPGRWALLQMFGDTVALPDWGTEELMVGLRVLLSRAGQELSDREPPFKFALFIDGIDDLEELERTALIELLLQAGAYPSVKICVTSRPGVFSDVAHRGPMLQLENLTRNGMKVHIYGRLQSTLGIQGQLGAQPLDTQKLFDDILDKAHGVFSWALVVGKYLLIQLQEGRKLVYLRRILSGLPDDLSGVFQAIWESIDPQYQREASHYFLILQTYTKHGLVPSAAGFWLGDDHIPLDIDTTNELLGTSVTSSLAERLRSRTRGLLDVSSPGHYAESRVEYSSQATEEWIRKNWDDLSSHLNPDFDPNLWILKGETLRIPLEGHICPDPPLLWLHLRSLFLLARNVRDSPSNNTMLVRIMDKLDEQITLTVATRRDEFTTYIYPAAPGPVSRNDRSDAGDLHWCNKMLVDLRVHPARLVDPAYRWKEVGFVGLMALFQVPQYLKTKLSQELSRDPGLTLSPPQTMPVFMCVALSRPLSTDSEWTDFVRAFLPFFTRGQVKNAIAALLPGEIKTRLEAHVNPAWRLGTGAHIRRPRGTRPVPKAEGGILRCAFLRGKFGCLG